MSVQSIARVPNICSTQYENLTPEKRREMALQSTTMAEVSQVFKACFLCGSKGCPTTVVFNKIIGEQNPPNNPGPMYYVRAFEQNQHLFTELDQRLLSAMNRALVGSGLPDRALQGYGLEGSANEYSLYNEIAQAAYTQFVQEECVK